MALNNLFDVGLTSKAFFESLGFRSSIKKGQATISSASKKQDIASKSTTEAEYNALFMAADNVIWKRHY